MDFNWLLARRSSVSALILRSNAEIRRISNVWSSKRPQREAPHPRGDDEEVLGRLKVVGRLTHSKSSTAYTPRTELRRSTPDHPMSDAADEDGHDGYGGKPHRVGRLDPTPDQEQEEVALVVVGRDEVSQRTGAPARRTRKGMPMKKSRTTERQIPPVGAA